VSPISRSAVVLGKWGSRFALGVIQIAFAMITGTVLFKIDWGPHLWTVVAVLLAYAALAASLGMLLGNFARTEKQVIGIGVISTNILAALGGCWWPIEITPRWARQIALALPTGWAMDALHKLMSFGATPPSVVPHIAACLIAALCASLLIARSFRFQ
jgi:ABC-type multidrug transport system permease subunit